MTNRFAALLRVRRLREEQRLADATRAQQDHAEAARTHERATSELAAAPSPAEPLTAEQLALHRMYGIALSAAASIARDELARMERAARDAERRRVDAGIDRRIVERLDARDRARQALQASRRAELMLDDAALRQWRRSP